MTVTKDPKDAASAPAWEDMPQIDGEPEKFDPHPELDEYLRSTYTVAHLRGLSHKLALQLQEAREEHVLKVDTIATLALENMRELLRVSEVQLTRAESVINYFRRWVDSGKVVLMAERIASLEATNAVLGRELAAKNSEVKNGTELQARGGDPTTGG